LTDAGAPRTTAERDDSSGPPAAGIGFTVSLFFATAAFPEGALPGQTKMGALFSFAAAPRVPVSVPGRL
jgi:hypothetical protein